MFVQNWHQDFPDIRADGELVARGSAGTALFFGVAAALLGISGTVWCEQQSAMLGGAVADTLSPRCVLGRL